MLDLQQAYQYRRLYPFESSNHIALEIEVTFAAEMPESGWHDPIRTFAGQSVRLRPCLSPVQTRGRDMAEWTWQTTEGQVVDNATWRCLPRPIDVFPRLWQICYEWDGDHGTRLRTYQEALDALPKDCRAIYAGTQR